MSIHNDIPALIRQGVEDHLNGQLNAAEKKYLEVLEIEPDHAVAYNNLGYLWMQQSRLEKAKEAFLKAIHINPNYAAAFCNLGQTLLFLYEIDDSEACLLNALSLNAQDINAAETLAQLYMAKGDSGRSAYYWQKCYEIKPKTNYLIQLAQSLMVSGQIEDAQQILENITATQNEEPKALYLLGLIHFMGQNFGIAQKYLRQCLGLEPENLEARHTLALALLKSERTSDAIQELERVLLLNPEHIEARNNLAVLELSLEQQDQAFKNFEIVLQKDHQNAKALYHKSLILINRKEYSLARETIVKLMENGDSEYKQNASLLLESLSIQT